MNKIIPDHKELEKRFAQVLSSMDLPPDKARLLKQYDDEKKWDLIRDQERMVAKNPPSFYLEKLVSFMDPKGHKFLKKRKNNGSSSTQVLRDLEISLRTNNIEWVREFLNEQNDGLDILIRYLGLANFEMQRILVQLEQENRDKNFNNPYAIDPLSNSSQQHNNQHHPSNQNGGQLLQSLAGVGKTSSPNKTINPKHQMNGVGQHLDTMHASSPDSTDISYTSSSDKSSMRRKKMVSQKDSQRAGIPSHANNNGSVVDGNDKSHNHLQNGNYKETNNSHYLPTNFESDAGDYQKNQHHHKDLLASTTTTATPFNLILNSLVQLTTGAAANITSSFTSANGAASCLITEDPSTDVHLCVMCLRALLNNKYGFNQVISHRDAINYIAISLMHRSYRTKAQVLELLAAVCLVQGGHEIIMTAFDYFREVNRERKRFQTLMYYFRNYSGDFNVDFMVACMQFINIVVHSVESMNYRVSLQYSFTKIGLDQYLEKLKHTESEQLQLQISAYLGNFCDVGVLMQEAEQKNGALEQVSELQEQLESMNDKLIETENQAMARIVEMQTFIENINKEKEEIKKMYEKADYEACTLKKNYSDKESDYIQKQNELDRIMNEYLYLKEQFMAIEKKAGLNASSTSPASIPFVAGMKPFPPAPSFSFECPSTTFDNTTTNIHHHHHIPPPPPPPPLPFLSQLIRPNLPASSNALSSSFLVQQHNLHHNNNNPAIPNIPPLTNDASANAACLEAVAIKRRIETKYKLPLLNWIPLKPRQLKGTIFNDLDDEALLKVIDFDTFEELFKLGSQQKNFDPHNPNSTLPGNAGTKIEATFNNTAELNGHPQTDGSCLPPNASSTVNGYYGKSAKSKTLNSLLESTRIRNLAITRRRLDLQDNDIVRAINNLDLKILDLETVDILIRMLPTEIEKKAYKTYESEGRQVNKLTPEDQFLHQLCKIDRLHVKLSIMSFMGNFSETVHLVTPQIHSLIVASKSTRNSEKLKKVFEIILAFGNYLNSGRKGGVYGFKIQSLDTLNILKAPINKEISLLRYIVQTIMNHFPQYLNFHNELSYIEKAVDVSLENIQTDVHELVKGMEEAIKEYNTRKANPINASCNSKETLLVLEEFISTSQDKLNKVKTEAKTAEESYGEVVEYFGESAKSLPPNSFFPLFVRFIRQFKQNQDEIQQNIDNLKKSTQQLSPPRSCTYHQNSSNTIKSKTTRNRKSGESGNSNYPMLHELRKKQGQNVTQNGIICDGSSMTESSLSNKIPQLISQDEVYHGALEDILTDLKKEPFRASESLPRKSGIFITSR